MGQRTCLNYCSFLISKLISRVIGIAEDFLSIEVSSSSQVRAFTEPER